MATQLKEQNPYLFSIVNHKFDRQVHETLNAYLKYDHAIKQRMHETYSYMEIEKMHRAKLDPNTGQLKPYWINNMRSDFAHKYI